MFIIFNEEGDVLSWSDLEPDYSDLASRKEIAVYTEEVLKPFNVILGKYGTIFEPAPTPVTHEQLQEKLTISILTQRNKKLAETDWLVTRHLEQKMLEIPQTLSVVEFNNLLAYRQQLRDITTDPDFPNCSIPELLI